MEVPENTNQHLLFLSKGGEVSLCEFESCLITYVGRFETRDAVADRLEEEGASMEVVNRVRIGGNK